MKQFVSAEIEIVPAGYTARFRVLIGDRVPVRVQFLLMATNVAGKTIEAGRSKTLSCDGLLDRSEAATRELAKLVIKAETMGLQTEMSSGSGLWFERKFERKIL
jgi:hypothetical protein